MLKPEENILAHSFFAHCFLICLFSLYSESSFFYQEINLYNNNVEIKVVEENNAPLVTIPSASRKQVEKFVEQNQVTTNKSAILSDKKKKESKVLNKSKIVEKDKGSSASNASKQKKQNQKSGTGKTNKIQGVSKLAFQKLVNEFIVEVQDIIQKEWFPPEEFAARNDIAVYVEITIDKYSYITSYKFINEQNSMEYKAVKESVIRTLNSPNVNPLPLKKKVIAQKVTLSFIPRDVL